ncbi:uncharacterized protein DS421_3g89450 [Arachis hypogaea]|nr:uncharacterized protein DS421_3g89450 [Arachis hypogaea]
MRYQSSIVIVKSFYVQFLVRNHCTFLQMTSGLNKAHILEPSCEFGSPKPLKASWRRSITENYPLKFVSNTRLRLSPLNCRTYGYFLSSYWANDDKVRNALNIQREQKRNGNAAPIIYPTRRISLAAFHIMQSSAEKAIVR